MPERTPRENPKLRTHALLFQGDYSDDGTEDPFGSYEDDNDDAEMDATSEWARREEEKYKEKKKKWLENAKPPVRVPEIDDRGRSYGRGSRKTASARVWIQPGMGEIVINRKHFIDYFKRSTHRDHILAPLVATQTCGLFDIQCHVQGGGLTGQAGAVRHGLARALNSYNPDLYRPPLKHLGYLTRDPRKVERKKVGKVKARKSPQWVRR